ncbi:MAG: serine/threonine protein kinase [Chloroflexaceae bacterium]|nr:serine/threonine protein kinase [Chloroflexaceae bacterium]
MRNEFRRSPSLLEAAVMPLAAPLIPGNRLSDRYQILRLLGEGGFSYTFLAEDCHWPSRRHCAVKQLKTPFQASWEEAKRLFFAEAQTLEQLGKHPQIPELYAYFEEEQQFFLVQEYVEGQSLAAELHLDAPQPALKSEAAAIALLQEILEILVFVHDHRAIHRDIKPDNLLRRRDGRLELIDFGAVKLAASQLLSRQGLPTLAIGTPGYCPPEQQRGTPFLSSDIYAVGMVAVAALTGRSPHLLAVDPGTGAVDWQELVSISPGLGKFWRP